MPSCFLSFYKHTIPPPLHACTTIRRALFHIVTKNFFIDFLFRIIIFQWDYMPILTYVVTLITSLSFPLAFPLFVISIIEFCTAASQCMAPSTSRLFIDIDYRAHYYKNGQKVFTYISRRLLVCISLHAKMTQ